MRIVCGADGCRVGWVAVTKDLQSGEIRWQVYGSARDLVLASPSAQIIALDIPIGLPGRGARDADLEGRQLLGKPRGSRVFPAPIRAVLYAGSYQAACQTRV
jgi:predicted RNase H-like nuclease